MTDALRGVAMVLLLFVLAALAVAGRWLFYDHLLPGGVLTIPLL